jgi:hypothetical protein
MYMLPPQLSYEKRGPRYPSSKSSERRSSYCGIFAYTSTRIFLQRFSSASKACFEEPRLLANHVKTRLLRQALTLLTRCTVLFDRLINTIERECVAVQHGRVRRDHLKFQATLTQINSRTEALERSAGPFQITQI